MSFQCHETGPVFRTSPLLGTVRHAFTTRKGGASAAPWDTLNLAPGRGDAAEAVEENYRRLCAAVDVDPARLVLAKQVQGTTIRACTEDDAGKGRAKERDYTADGLVTNVPGLPLVVFSADCGIILLYDPENRAAGAVHAGWRGCAAGILEKAAEAMARAYGTRPEKLLAAVGPCIGPCCFETDGDVPEAMRAALGREAEPYLSRRGAKWHVDLAGLNRQWLLRAGLLPEHIDLCGLCTACRRDLFWSHRKLGEARGAQAALIAL